MNAGLEVSLSTLGVPIALCLAFLAAHISIRWLAPGADPAILPIVFVLSGVGITMLTRLNEAYAVNQVIWLFLSVAAMVGVLFVVRNLDKLAEYKYTLGIVGVALLLLPMPGCALRSTAPSQAGIGSFSFQPGEFAKILIVLFLAFYLAANREALSVSMRQVSPFKVPRIRMLPPLLIMWGISLLLVVFERDLGSALLFFVFFVIMLFVSTGRVSYVVVSSLLLAVGGAFCYRFFGHVQTRINIWLDPWSDAQGGGYQIVQSLYSCRRRAWWHGTARLPTSIISPAVSPDFIFSAIGEEMGLLGSSAVLVLFLLLCVRGFATAARAKSDSSAFAAVGLTSALGFQAFLIVGGVTKFLPLTGVTLPFMSQGGTSLLASFIIVALLLRAGDEATGREALIETAGAQDSSRDPFSVAAGRIAAAGAESRMGAHADAVVHGKHARGHFNVLRRVRRPGPRGPGQAPDHAHRGLLASVCRAHRQPDVRHGG